MSIKKYKKEFSESKEAVTILQADEKLLENPKYNIVMVTKEISDAINMALKNSEFIKSDPDNIGRFKNNLITFLKK